LEVLDFASDLDLDGFDQVAVPSLDNSNSDPPTMLTRNRSPNPAVPLILSVSNAVDRVAKPTHPTDDDDDAKIWSADQEGGGEGGEGGALARDRRALIEIFLSCGGRVKPCITAATLLRQHY
jgi:hypothetical protein